MNIDLAELLPLFSQFRELKSLDLSNNAMKNLPSNMSCLLKLDTLNINGNVFENTYNTIDRLTSLPRLSNLQINLNEEEQVDYIMKQLPTLEYLNGLFVERDDEEEEEEEDEDEEQVHIKAENAQDDQPVSHVQTQPPPVIEEEVPQTHENENIDPYEDYQETR